MTDSLDALPPLRDVVRALAADKRFGQHFLTDPNILRRIAEAAGALDEGVVVEVGPGPGGLTRALLAAGAQNLVAIDIDPRCAEAAEDIARRADGRLAVLRQDALEVEIAGLGPPPRRIVANLPYNIATPLLVAWLRAIATEADAFVGMTLMFQKEVAERLTATPGEKAYGRLSVLTQWLTDVRKAFDLPPGAFTPPPKVSSSVVQFWPKASPPPGDALFQAMERTTAAAFGQRRKMLRQSLRPLGDAAALLASADIDPTRRAETLSVAEFERLASASSR